MIEMYEMQIINSGINQARIIKIIIYERSLHDVEKLSNAHPIKYASDTYRFHPRRGNTEKQIDVPHINVSIRFACDFRILLDVSNGLFIARALSQLTAARDQISESAATDARNP